MWRTFGGSRTDRRKIYKERSKYCSERRFYVLEVSGDQCDQVALLPGIGKFASSWSCSLYVIGVQNLIGEAKSYGLIEWNLEKPIECSLPFKAIFVVAEGTAFLDVSKESTQDL